MKSEIFGMRDNVKNTQYDKVTFSNDMTDEELLKSKEVQQIAAAARRHEGADVRLKGNTVIIDNLIYDRSNFDKLPYNITTANASQIVTPRGLFFQGHLSPFSNLFNIQIHDEANNFIGTSVEQCLVVRKAEFHRDISLRDQAMKTTNPYTVMNIGRKIETSQAWKQREPNDLYDLNRMKAIQNPSHADRLVNNTSTDFYEATKNRWYGCGALLSEVKKVGTNPLPRPLRTPPL